MDSDDIILREDVNVPWCGFTHAVYYGARQVFRMTG